MYKIKNIIKPLVLLSSITISSSNDNNQNLQQVNYVKCNTKALISNFINTNSEQSQNLNKPCEKPKKSLSEIQCDIGLSCKQYLHNYGIINTNNETLTIADNDSKSLKILKNSIREVLCLPESSKAYMHYNIGGFIRSEDDYSIEKKFHKDYFIDVYLTMRDKFKIHFALDLHTNEVKVEDHHTNEQELKNIIEVLNGNYSIVPSLTEREIRRIFLYIAQEFRFHNFIEHNNNDFNIKNLNNMIMLMKKAVIIIVKSKNDSILNIELLGDFTVRDILEFSLASKFVSNLEETILAKKFYGSHPLVMKKKNTCSKLEKISRKNGFPEHRSIKEANAINNKEIVNIYLKCKELRHLVFKASKIYIDQKRGVIDNNHPLKKTIDQFYCLQKYIKSLIEEK